MELPTRDLAEILGIGVRQVQSLETQGVLAKSRHGTWAAALNVQAYVQHRVKSESERLRNISGVSTSQSRVTDARAREIELRVAREEHKLIDITEHDAVFDEAFGTLKSRLSSVPARATRDVALRKTIETEIDDALRACSEHFEQATADLAATGEAAAPVAEDDA